LLFLVFGFCGRKSNALEECDATRKKNLKQSSKTKPNKKTKKKPKKKREKIEEGIFSMGLNLDLSVTDERTNSKPSSCERQNYKESSCKAP